MRLNNLKKMRYNFTKKGCWSVKIESKAGNFWENEFEYSTERLTRKYNCSEW